MPFAFIASASNGSADTSNVTTPPINTTGATLLFAVGSQLQLASSGTLTDSYSNTWQTLTVRDGGVCRTIGRYCIGGTVGAGHTFTHALSSTYPSLCVLAFSGVSPVYDSQNGAGVSGGTSLNSGSVTPGAAGGLVISGLTFFQSSSGHAVSGGGLSIAETVAFGSGVHFGSIAAYEIQGAATARAAAWSWSGADDASTVIAAFTLPGGGGGGGGQTFTSLLVSP